MSKKDKTTKTKSEAKNEKSQKKEYKKEKKKLHSLEKEIKKKEKSIGKLNKEIKKEEKALNKLQEKKETLLVAFKLLEVSSTNGSVQTDENITVEAKVPAVPVAPVAKKRTPKKEAPKASPEKETEKQI